MAANILFSSSQASLSGGGQKSLLLLLKQLDRKKHAPILLVPAPGEFSNAAQSQDIKTIILPMRRLLRFGLFIIPTLLKTMRNESISLIHTDAPRQTLYLGIAARWAGIPLVWHVRVSTSEPRPYEWLLYSLSTKVIAVSQAAARRFQGFPLNSKKVVLIPTAVPVSERPSQISTQKEIRIGILGRIEPAKGIEEFIRAAANVLKEYPSARILVAGEGESNYIAAMKQLASTLSISDSIEFTGFVSDSISFLAGLTILINASKAIGRTGSEGMARAIIEAMAMEKPVIATNTGGNPEAVIHGLTGLIVPEGDASALSAALISLLKDPDLAYRMGREGRKRAEECFDSKKQIAAIESIYAELLPRKHDQ